MTGFWIGVVVTVFPTWWVASRVTEVRYGLHEAGRAWGRRKAYRK